ncbi:type II and III secretion system protein [Thermodesulfatator indicus DSM 15286]|uniref:Type II and III secretion system protein n=1 Tax=Thermodesulfatator indicus (strain DSM 15286 / JCM 11887 / CIR29812) TaxID=667014 RepID=F8ACA1_THEID|nr:type II and III secretion system protein [Thermodesulfatator indicus]AEH45736.1 type II and III secretion system protein [Thermodesulfatator indicus DSM 15286]
MKKSIAILFIIFALTACASQQTIPPKKTDNLPQINLPVAPQKETENNLTLSNLKPIFKKLSPIEKEKISISVINEDFEKILALIARTADLNLIIDNDIKKELPEEQKFITINLNNVTLKNALDVITRLTGTTYKIKDGIIYVKLYDEKLFDLNFLTTVRKVNYNIGGDVLGGNQDNQNTSNPLKGEIELSGNSKENDIFSIIEKNIKNLLSKNGKYILNKYTGTLYVRDKAENLRRISNFINKVKEKYSKQVLIEAEIIEVNLNKNYQLGINWQNILQNDLKNTLHLSSTTSFLWNNSGAFTFTLTGNPYFNIIVNAIEKYGQVKIVSNPRIRTLHGQPAFIGVGKSIAYIKEITKETTSSEGITTASTNIETSSIFDGLAFKVTPYIDDKNNILLSIVPIKSDIISLEKSKIADYEITLPEISLRETSTVVKTKNNDLIVISGLIMNKNEKNNNSVPVISNIPIIGNIFKSKEESSSKVELIILIKASIIK